jgi:formylglycine-generating enzyme required for sulfatase activity
MRSGARASRAAGAVGVAWVAAASCAPPPSASAGIDLQLGGLSGVTATLSIEDDDGQPATFDVFDRAGVAYRARGSVELGCPDGVDGAVCSAEVVLDPGAYLFALAIAQRDRCDTSSTTLTLSSGAQPIAFVRDDAVNVPLAIDRTDFDDDGDGIVNALEPVVCGRFDVADGALPPRYCAGGDDDPCCAGAPSPLQGQRAVFGGAYRTADGAEVTIAPFALDATELTWRALSRCVAAGACLAGQRDHAARARLRDPALDLDAPVTGLVPRDAAALCAWRGGRLPDDAEWDFAAAARPDGGRATYPFDLPPETGPGAIACREGEGGVAVNHAARGRACPGAPTAVGSYPSTFVERGAGSPVADLAGNVGEWTVRRGAVGGAGDDPAVPDDGPVTVDSATDPFPDGVVEVDVRGGSADGIVELLENDVVVRVARTAPGAGQRLGALASTTGVRCAFDVSDDDDGAALPVEEPACGADR